MERRKVDDPLVMVAILFGIEGAEILSFVEDEESEHGAFGILIEMPLVDTWCPTCGTEAIELDPVKVELPATTAGLADVLIARKRRQWRCADPDCPQEVFDEEGRGGRQVRRPCRSASSVEEAPPPQRGLTIPSNDQSGLSMPDESPRLWP